MESQAVFQVFFQGERPLFRVVCKSPCLEYSVLKTAISRHCLEFGIMAAMGWHRVLNMSSVNVRLLISHGAWDFGSFDTCVTFTPIPSLPPSLCGKNSEFFPTLTFLIMQSSCCLHLSQKILYWDLSISLVSWRHCLEISLFSRQCHKDFYTTQGGNSIGLNLSPKRSPKEAPNWILHRKCA